MFDKILIATDNSPLMKNAMEYTATLFPYADYHMMNVINKSDGSVPQTPLMHSQLEDISKEAIEDGKKILSGMGIREIDTARPEGSPSQELLHYVDKKKIDLLVMAAYSKEGTQEIHIGNTALNYIKERSIPTLLFSWDCEVTIPGKIFNPTTFSSYSMEASMIALNLASQFEADLTTYKIGKNDSGASSRRIKRIADKGDVNFTLKVDEDASGKKLIKESKTHDLIIGSRGRGGLLYKLRSLFPKLSLTSLEKELIAGCDIPYLMVGD